MREQFTHHISITASHLIHAANILNTLSFLYISLYIGRIRDENSTLVTVQPQTVKMSNISTQTSWPAKASTIPFNCHFESTKKLPRGHILHRNWQSVKRSFWGIRTRYLFLVLNTDSRRISAQHHFCLSRLRSEWAALTPHLTHDGLFQRRDFPGNWLDASKDGLHHHSWHITSHC